LKIILLLHVTLESLCTDKKYTATWIVLKGTSHTILITIKFYYKTKIFLYLLLPVSRQGVQAKHRKVRTLIGKTLNANSYLKI